MNFDFSPEQQQFRDQLRRFLEHQGGRAPARRVLEGHDPYDRTLWAGLIELGALELAIPEIYGGAGLGFLEQCVVAEELGRVLAPVPFLSSLGVCSEAIRRFGSEAQREKWLPRLAKGTAIGTWGLAEGGVGKNQCYWTAGELFGSKAPVLDGLVADLMVVATADVLALVNLNDPRVTRRDIATLDPSRPSAMVTFEAAPADLLPRGANGWPALSAHAAVLLAFEQLGGAQAALEMARAYALERSAFGRRIGSFQAIKHKLADMYAKIELARSHCYHGAWAVSSEADEAPLAAAGARCSAIDAFEFAAIENVQTHGGIGATWESDCQLFYRRSRMTALLLGSRYEWQDRLVVALAAE